MSILLREAKALPELFCLQLLVCLAKGKIDAA